MATSVTETFEPLTGWFNSLEAATDPPVLPVDLRPAGELSQCTDWLAASTCGGFDFSTVVDCDGFTRYCDASAFFDCLTEHTTCDTGGPEDVATIDMWPCVDELVCPD